ncbi:MAG: helix-turn-helix domain-containing protein [Verrucomicrobiae bacterium]|nr:helix-turn-helix domain-containing protein [Verrucomicrobiae bacterium]
MNFGEKLKGLRTQRGWSQEELAKELGLTRRTVISYEKGSSYPRTRDAYRKIADILNVDVNFLMTENEEFMMEVGAQFGQRGQKQANDILNRTKELFAGGTLSSEDQKAFALEMQKIFMDSKNEAKKFTPKKYRTSSNTDDTQ